MKLYIITLSVPDDFDPELLEVELAYPSDNVEIKSEGFLSSEELTKVIDSMSIETVKLSPSNIVIAKFPADSDPGPTQYFLNILKDQFEEIGCTFIAIVNDIDVLVQNSAEALKMLEMMKQKINSKSIIKLT